MFHFMICCMGIININVGAEATKFPYYIHNLTIADIRAIFLKGNAKHQYAGLIYWQVIFCHQLDHAVSNMNTHIVIDPSAGKNHFGMIAEALSFVGEIIWIYTYTMTTNKPWLE